MPRDASSTYSLPTGYLAVTGQTVLASQHNAPLEDIASSLTNSLARDGSGPMLAPLDMGGFKVTNAGEATTSGDLVTKAALDAAVALLSSQLIQTGALQYFARITAPTGWLITNGQTIGNGSSGATARANSDTEDLYTMLWENFSNTLLPIQDSSGTATTRGASAAADYAANKRLSLPDDQGLFLRSLSTSSSRDSGRAFGSVQEDAYKSHNHTGTTSSDTHSHTIDSTRRTGTTGEVVAGDKNILGLLSDSVDKTITTSSDTHNHTFTTASSGGAETRPMNRAYVLCIKL